MIVCKQSTMPERDGLEAIKAAENLAGISNRPKVVGVNFSQDLDTNRQEENDLKEVKDLEDILQGFKKSFLLKETKTDETDSTESSRRNSDSERKIKTFLNLPPIVLSKPF